MNFSFRLGSDHERRIQRFISNGDYDSAERYLKSIRANSHEINSEIQLLLAQVKWFSGHTADAIDLLSDYLDRGGNDYGLFWLLGRILFADGQFERNVEILELGIQQWPDQPELLALLGECNRRLERFSEAKGVLKRAIELDPINPDARQSLVFLYLDLGSEIKAEKEIEDYLISAPKIASAHVFKADYLYLHKYAPQSALPFYENGLALFPSRANYYSRNFSTESYPEGIAESYILALEECGLFELAYKVASNEFTGAERSYWHAYLNHQAGDMNSARTQYEKASKKDPTKPLYRYMHALTLIATGFQKEAKEALNIAEKQNPSGEYAEWIAGAKKAIRLAQSITNGNTERIFNFHEDISGQALLSACNVYEELGERELLMDGLSSLAAVQPNNLQVRLRLAKVRVELGQYDKAITDLKKLTTIRPYYFDAWLQLAKAAKAAGNSQLATTAIRNANTIPDLTRGQIQELSSLTGPENSQ